MSTRPIVPTPLPIAGLALALLLFPQPAAAHGGDSDWSGLDREIEGLRGALGGAGGARLGATLRAQYQASNIEPVPGMGNQSEVLLGNADVWTEGRVGQYDYYVRANVLGDATLLEDAWAATPLESWSTLRVGRFKTPILRSSTIDPDEQMMVDRTVLGRVFDTWDEGIMLFGEWEGAEYSVAMQNGASGLANEYLYTGRIEWKLGEGVEGISSAFGRNSARSDPQYAGTLGASALQEQSLTNGGALAFDLAALQGNWFYHAELVELDTLPGLVAVGPGLPEFPLESDTSPWSVSAAYLWPDTRLELAARWQDLDDSFGTQLLTAGVNWYGAGTNARWQIDVTDVDGKLVNATFIQIGLTVSIGQDTPRVFSFQ